jgi:hypothetical protein
MLARFALFKYRAAYFEKPAPLCGPQVVPSTTAQWASQSKFLARNNKTAFERVVRLNVTRR